MATNPRPADETVRALCAAARYDEAVALVLEAHGGEVMRFLVHRAGDPELASEAFSTFSEDLLRGLPRFAFAASVRTWVFTLAHHALARCRKRLTRVRQSQRSISELESATVQAKERTVTPHYLRTETKLRMRELRARLPEDDQLVIDLRTTRRFAWKDIARITLGSEASDETSIDREAARVRKRFQLAIERLRELAAAEGLISRSNGD